MICRSWMRDALADAAASTPVTWVKHRLGKALRERRRLIFEDLPVDCSAVGKLQPRGPRIEGFACDRSDLSPLKPLGFHGNEDALHPQTASLLFSPLFPTPSLKLPEAGGGGSSVSIVYPGFNRPIRSSQLTFRSDGTRHTSDGT